MAIKIKGYELQEYLPFISVHLGCALVFVAGWSWTALAIAVFLYIIRAFGITAGFHRYFAHRSYKTSRFFQFVLAFIATSAGQMGPLWWAGHHRIHHRRSDKEGDIHSPVIDGFFKSHIGWILQKENRETNFEVIADFAKYPELRFLNRFYLLPPLFLALGLFVLGMFLESYFPSLKTSGLQLLAWGFFVSTVALYHATFFINSLAHTWGTRRFETDDASRNNLFLALITLGEGWHNNHHRYPHSTRQGFLPWEVDPTYWVLKFFERLGLVREMKEPPAELKQRHQNARAA
jgi:stearoyl-CoA desaturase (delta-9 desaturase)